MKFPKLLSVIAIVTCFSATAAFAAPQVSKPENTSSQQKLNDTVKKDKKDLKGREHRQKDKIKNKQELSKDPIKALEKRKEKIQSLLREGKITKEKADELTKKLDLRIKEIKEFNKLPLQQKKDKLISNFKTHLDKKVKEGKMTQDERDTLLKNYTEKINQWDGNGYPQFHDKGMKYEMKHDKKLKNK